MPRFRIFATALLFSVIPLGATIGVTSVHATDSGASDVSAVTTTLPEYNYDLENDPSACLNSNPRPNCGKKPQQSGDRGGWMQYTVMGVMLGALGVIATVLISNVIKRDRAITEQLKQSGK